MAIRIEFFFYGFDFTNILNAHATKLKFQRLVSLFFRTFGFFIHNCQMKIEIQFVNGIYENDLPFSISKLHQEIVKINSFLFVPPVLVCVFSFFFLYSH